MTFALDLSRFAGKSNAKMDMAIKKISLEAFSSIVMKSPVDTGRFRANWTYAVGSFSTQTSEQTDKGGVSTIGKISAGLMSTKINGSYLYLTNSLSYADRLENGWSQQAPAGMVKLTLLEITSHYGV